MLTGSTAQMGQTASLDSPVGPVRVVASAGGIHAIRVGDMGGASADAHPAGDPGSPRPSALGAALEQLEAYFAGSLTCFDLPLAAGGTPFQQSVWAALLRIPFGQTRSYGRIAADLGVPGSARAVGLANGRNPIAIVVPCHRVIGADGSLTGYAGGLECKRWLLAHEGGPPSLF